MCRSRPLFFSSALRVLGAERNAVAPPTLRRAFQTAGYDWTWASTQKGLVDNVRTCACSYAPMRTCASLVQAPAPAPRPAQERSIPSPRGAPAGVQWLRCVLPGIFLRAAGPSASASEQHARTRAQTHMRTQTQTQNTHAHACIVLYARMLLFQVIELPQWRPSYSYHGRKGCGAVRVPLSPYKLVRDPIGSGTNGSSK